MRTRPRCASSCATSCSRPRRTRSRHRRRRPCPPEASSSKRPHGGPALRGPAGGPHARITCRPMAADLDRAVQTVVRGSLGVQAGEDVLVIADEGTRDIGEALRRAAADAGGGAGLAPLGERAAGRPQPPPAIAPAPPPAPALLPPPRRPPPP